MSMFDNAIDLDKQVTPKADMTVGEPDNAATIPTEDVVTRKPHYFTITLDVIFDGPNSVRFRNALIMDIDLNNGYLMFEVDTKRFVYNLANVVSFSLDKQDGYTNVDN